MTVSIFYINLNARSINLNLQPIITLISLEKFTSKISLIMYDLYFERRLYEK